MIPRPFTHLPLPLTFSESCSVRNFLISRRTVSFSDPGLHLTVHRLGSLEVRGQRPMP